MNGHFLLKQKTESESQQQHQAAKIIPQKHETKKRGIPPIGCSDQDETRAAAPLPASVTDQAQNEEKNNRSAASSPVVM